jgi:putative transposase
MAGVRRVVIQEAETDLKALMRQQKQVGDKERIQLLYLLKSGQAQTITQAAELLGRGRATLQRWLAKYQAGGIAALLERHLPPGQECHIPPDAQAELQHRLSSTQGFGSYKEIQTWLEQEYGHRMSYQGVHNHVRYRLGAKLKRPRPQSSQQDPNQVFF